MGESIVMDGDNNTVRVLDSTGFVRLVDTMGDDSSIVQAARTSYGRGTKSTREDAGLIRYLMRHQHTTPFEMCEYKFHIKCPIFVARQWLRHRTASVNEYSLRYSEARDEFYSPPQFFGQDDKNRQSSSERGIGDQYNAHDTVGAANTDAYSKYQNLLSLGVSRETARIVLPVSSYTEFYWKIDLHNLFHFLQLRLDSHAQYEIRAFASAVAEFVKEKNPLAWQAFKEYKLEAETFSAGEVRLLRHIINVFLDEYDLLNKEWYNYFGDDPTDKTLEQRRSELLEKLDIDGSV